MIINKINNPFDYKRITHSLLFLIITSFFVLTTIHLYPFDNNLNQILLGIDDWSLYARYAMDIKHNGILIPAQNYVYIGPGGFLYNYFVVCCFIVFGENVIPVYLIQSLLLGLSVAFIYWAFASKMKPFTGLCFLLTLSVFAYLDVYRHYTCRLLSESLGVFSVSLFVYFLVKGLDENKFIKQFLAIVFLVTSMLIRPVVFPFGLILAIGLPVYFYMYRRSEIVKGFLFSLIIAVGMSVIALRNYLICKQLVFLPSIGFSDTKLQTAKISFLYLLKKILFSIGYLPALAPVYHIRYHWFIMCGLFIFYVINKIYSKTKFTHWEFLLLLFVFFYYLFSIYFVQIDSYGFRAFVPITFVMLAFCFMGVDKLFNKL